MVLYNKKEYKTFMDTKLTIDLVDYWKSGYHKLYELYSSALRHENHLMDEKKELENKINHLGTQIEMLVVEKMELKNEIITLKRIINESDMNATLGNNFIKNGNKIDQYGEC